jgi:hypothetical protein
MPRSLNDIGLTIAKKPGIGKRIRHSRFMDKYRRQKGVGFVKEVAKTGLTTAINFIPIPIVKDLLAIAFDTGVKVARSLYVERKRGKHKDAGDPGEVKWGWKDIDLSAFDRYRWKIWHAHKELVDAVEYLGEHGDDTASICNDVVGAWAKYHYLMHRLDLFEEQLEAIHTLIKKTRHWMNGVENAVEAQDFQDIILKYDDIALEEEDTDEIVVGYLSPYQRRHSHCNPELCAHKSKGLTVPSERDEIARRAVGEVVSQFWDTIVADSISDLPGGTNIFTG